MCAGFLAEGYEPGGQYPWQVLLDEALTLFERRAHALLAAIWDIRDPFITSPASSAKLTRLGDLSLHRSLVTFVDVLDLIFREFRCVLLRALPAID